MAQHLHLMEKLMNNSMTDLTSFGGRGRGNDKIYVKINSISNRLKQLKQLIKVTSMQILVNKFHYLDPFNFFVN